MANHAKIGGGGNTAQPVGGMAMSPEIWRHIFDAIDDPIFLHDQEYRLLLANCAYLQAAGMEETEAIGKPYWEVFPRNGGPLPGCKRALEGERAESADEAKAGERLFISKGYPVRDEQGMVRYSLHILSDVTEQRKAELHFARLNRMYRTISRCNEALVRAGDELELAREMCQVLVEKGEFRAAWVGYAEQDAGKSVHPVASAGFKEGYLEGLGLTWADEGVGRGLTGQAIRTGEVAVSQDIDAVQKSETWRGLALQLGILSAAVLPLKVNGKVMGVLAVSGAEPDAFTEDVIELLAELAGDLAFGIGNLRSRAERMGILEKLELSLDHAVTAIAATVEMRDPYTAGHQRRVAKLAAAIATEMGMPTYQLEGLHMAGVVHDIGKIHVPAEILSSPAKLSDAEFEIIKTHPKAGWEILKGIDFPWPVAEMVYQHHEKLDGSGYPRGLKGEEILLEARILTVADVVEAMTSHRPYRPGFGVFPALQEISRNKGKLYDAAAVEACLRVFMEKNYEW